MAEAGYLEDWNHQEPPSERHGDPVVSVSFLAAQAFCKWAEVRMPKLEEWVRAVATLPDGKGLERLRHQGQKLGNWTATVGKGYRRLIAGIEADLGGYKLSAVSPRWSFRCAANDPES